MGRSASLFPESFSFFSPPLLLLDPRWAIPIKARVREANQARAINEVVNALRPDHLYPANAEDVWSMALAPKARL
jgi:hypothetical protein